MKARITLLHDETDTASTTLDVTDSLGDTETLTHRHNSCIVEIAEGNVLNVGAADVKPRKPKTKK